MQKFCAALKSLYKLKCLKLLNTNNFFNPVEIMKSHHQAPDHIVYSGAQSTASNYGRSGILGIKKYILPWPRLLHADRRLSIVQTVIIIVHGKVEHQSIGLAHKIKNMVSLYGTKLKGRPICRRP